jgi:ACT domain-containing protein
MDSQRAFLHGKRLRSFVVPHHTRKPEKCKRALTAAQRWGNVLSAVDKGGHGMQKALISVTGQDRVGIIAKVSNTLCEQNINILEISQTILDGCFTMLMVVDIAGAQESFQQIAARLSEAGKEIGVMVTIQRMELFAAMHRV